MAYHFKNLVFEGGGVKGVAYVGAMEVLEKKQILTEIKRVGGTSAGAINAVLFALGYTNKETLAILKKLDFNNFLDDSWGVARDTSRLINEFGWYKGDYFHEWISKRIAKKTGNPFTTFKDLVVAGRPELYIYGTNLSTRFGEIFSNEHTPTMRIADAVRISMSIPLFFTAYRNVRQDIYVDGGVLNNYPVKLFDREKYLNEEVSELNTKPSEYYADENARFLQTHPKSSPYCYNKETLGFRLDSKQEIAIFRDGSEPPQVKIDGFFDYAKALITTVIESQGNQHLHSDDWHRTIYIDTQGVGATDFSIADAKKMALKKSGAACAESYFKWFDDETNEAHNRPKLG
ncbi:MAG: patatin-like phospholipase family protein [Oleiphilus sp.]